MEHTPRMAGKSALVTGAAGGIGGCTAELFCAEGARVLIVDRDAARLEERAAIIRRNVPGAEVEALAGDVTDPAHAQKAVAFAVQRFGGLTTLVSNAAIRYVSPVERADPQKWQDLYSVNVLGALHFSKAALPELRKCANGAIVIVSSTYALVGRRDFGAYDATKAGLLALMRTLAHEGAEAGIRVNAVCPGGTLTPFTIGRAKERGLTLEQLTADMKVDALFKRWGEEREIAWPILWLASDEASFVTGAVLPVDGGTSIM